MTEKKKKFAMPVPTSDSESTASEPAPTVATPPAPTAEAVTATEAGMAATASESKPPDWTAGASAWWSKGQPAPSAGNADQGNSGQPGQSATTKSGEAGVKAAVDSGSAAAATDKSVKPISHESPEERANPSASTHKQAPRSRSVPPLNDKAKLAMGIVGVGLGALAAGLAKKRGRRIDPKSLQSLNKALLELAAPSGASGHSGEAAPKESRERAILREYLERGEREQQEARKREAERQEAEAKRRQEERQRREAEIEARRKRESEAQAEQQRREAAAATKAMLAAAEKARKAADDLQRRNAKGRIARAWLDHKAVVDGVRGTGIHVEFHVNGMEGTPGAVAAFLEYRDGTGVKNKNDKYGSSEGSVATWKAFTPSFADAHFKDFVLFIPYDEYHLSVRHVELRWRIVLRTDVSGRALDQTQVDLVWNEK